VETGYRHTRIKDRGRLDMVARPTEGFDA